MNRVDPAQGSVSGAMVGRRDELAVLHGFLAEATAQGGAMLLSGDPGVGKSMLLDAAEEATARQGARILRAAGAEFEANVTYAGLHRVLATVHDRFDRLSTPHHDALCGALGIGESAAGDRLLVSAAVLALLQDLATDRPLLVVVDDLHWVDLASAAVLGFVARRLAGSPIAFLAASRSATDGSFERLRLPELELQPLDDDSAAELVSARFPTLAPPVRRRVLTEAQGNPLALLELPTGLSGPQRVAVHALPPVLPLSERLRELFAARIGELAESTRRLLLLAALDGTGDLRVLQAATAGPTGLSDLAAAEEAGLVQVEETSNRVTFRHPLIRSAVVEFMSDDDRRRAHHQLAGLLTDEPERQAWHRAEATVGPDEQTAALLERAAYLRLRGGDAAAAVATLLRAAEFSPEGADRARRLAAAAYLGAAVTGDLVNVSRLLLDAAASDARLDGSLQAAVAAAFLLLNGGGDVATAHRLLVATIEAQSDQAVDDVSIGEALSTLQLACFFGGHADLWQPHFAALARFGERVPAVLMLCGRTFADPVRDAAAALDLLDSAVAGVRDEVDPTTIVQTAVAGFYLDRVAGCREALWRVVHDGREGGAIASAINALMLLAFDDVLTGQYAEAGRLADEGIELCRRHGYTLLAWPGRLAQALLAGIRGDADEVRVLAAELSSWAESHGMGTVEVYAQHARAVAALGLQQFDAAYLHATRISPAGTYAPYTAHALWVSMDLVEAAVRSGRRTEAKAHVAAMRAEGIAALSPRLALLVAGSTAMAADGRDAADRYEEAFAVPGADRWPFELARVRLSYGRYLRRQGATAEARTQLGAALDTFGRLGADPWVRQTGAALRAAGRHAPLGRPAGADNLTPKEREVAALAAAGLSNKEIGRQLFLSHRTVSDHLHKLFPKLGITSRAALGDALEALGPED